MEYNQTFFRMCGGKYLSVLILVLMEYNQTQWFKNVLNIVRSLNPCFSGIQSNNL